MEQSTFTTTQEPSKTSYAPTGAYSSEELAKRCRVSLKFVIKNRNRIAGAFRVGRIWRFDIAAVERAIKIRGELL